MPRSGPASLDSVERGMPRPRVPRLRPHWRIRTMGSTTTFCGEAALAIDSAAECFDPIRDRRLYRVLPSACARRAGRYDGGEGGGTVACGSQILRPTSRVRSSSPPSGIRSSTVHRSGSSSLTEAWTQSREKARPSTGGRWQSGTSERPNIMWRVRWSRRSQVVSASPSIWWCLAPSLRRRTRTDAMLWVCLIARRQDPVQDGCRYPDQ